MTRRTPPDPPITTPLSRIDRIVFAVIGAALTTAGVAMALTRSCAEVTVDCPAENPDCAAGIARCGTLSPGLIVAGAIFAGMGLTLILVAVRGRDRR